MKKNNCRILKCFNITNNTFSIIINPVSGSGLGLKNWSDIEKLLKQKNIKYSEYYTLNYNSTIKYCNEQISSGIRNFIVIGGDGTLNEVANSILTQTKIKISEFSISVIPVGTGNDWCRTFKIPFDYTKAIDIICKQNFKFQDVGKAFFHNNGKKQIRYFVNVAGAGFDAFVAYKTNLKSDKGQGSALSYLWNLFTGLFQYKSTRVKLNYEDKSTNNLVFSMSIGIGKFNGGGMMQLPEAIPDDGLFDTTVINKMSKLKIIRNIKKLYDGSIINVPNIDSFRAKKIMIDSEPKIKLELDGEICGESPFEFEIIPQYLKVCVPE